MSLKIKALLVLAFAAAWPTVASADCNNYIADFRNVIQRDLKEGRINQGTHDQIAEEVGRVDRVCRTDWQSRAMEALLSTQERYGYRK
jgi:hypothetical protein